VKKKERQEKKKKMQRVINNNNGNFGEMAAVVRATRLLPFQTKRQ